MEVFLSLMHVQKENNVYPIFTITINMLTGQNHDQSDLFGLNKFFKYLMDRLDCNKQF